MGAVHEQQRNEGRGCQEWYALSLSDVNVIENLIRHRSTFDGSYAMKKFECNNPYISNGCPQFSEPIEVMYLDLEALIAEINFDAKSKFILKALMLGYNDKDLSESLKIEPLNVKKRVKTICEKIKTKNDEKWYEFIEISGTIKISDDVKYKKCSKCGQYKRLESKFFGINASSKDGFNIYCRNCR